MHEAVVCMQVQGLIKPYLTNHGARTRGGTSVAPSWPSSREQVSAGSLSPLCCQ
uniref:Uncharacterized protein n=1 Tax=Arundo donax TaxID=35708 RepID=A0A0A9ART8_ARUDO